MLQKNSGFFLIELLLSLSVLLMLSLFFVPLFVDLTRQSQQLELEKHAEQLLFEELQASIINGSPSPDHSIFLNGIEYKLTWINRDPEGVQEVCVKLEKSQKTICRFAE
ncbi:hypothetical protein ACF5W4_12480 [Bacillota bacterium Lsc_1132]